MVRDGRRSTFTPKDQVKRRPHRDVDRLNGDDHDDDGNRDAGRLVYWKERT